MPKKRWCFRSFLSGCFRKGLKRLIRNGDQGFIHTGIVLPVLKKIDGSSRNRDEICCFGVFSFFLPTNGCAWYDTSVVKYEPRRANTIWGHDLCHSWYSSHRPPLARKSTGDLKRVTTSTNCRNAAPSQLKGKLDAVPPELIRTSRETSFTLRLCIDRVVQIS